MSSRTRAQIRRLDFFAGCRGSRVWALDRLGTTVELETSRTICREGEPGREFFVLIEGTASVHTQGGVLSILSSGAWFGEHALLTGRERSATVRTLTPTTLLVLDQREFATMLRIAPFLRSRLERSAALIDAIARPTFDDWYQVVQLGPVADIIANH